MSRPPSTPRSRPPRPRALNRERIVAAAKRLGEREGADRLTIRGLALELGVSPMAVYRHFPGKAAILGQLLDAFIADAAVTAHDEADWQAWMLETARRMHRALSARPELLPLLGDALVLGEPAMAVMDECLVVLQRAGFDRAGAACVFMQVIQALLGAVMLETAAQRPRNTDAGRERIALAEYREVQAALPVIQPVLTGQSFEAGVAALLAGLATRYGADRLRWQALGLDDGHLVADAARPASIACPVHAGIVTPLLALQQAAADAGFRLQVVSGWRSFARQAAIWDGKLRGERAVLDDAGCPVDLAALAPLQRVQAVLRWSALPGASRHHWGTDIDVVDAAALPEGYRVQLTQDEARGLCGPFHAWLDARIAANAAFGFYRPYDGDRGGVGPEPWHLSHRPLARQYAAVLTPEALQSCWQGSALAECDTVLAALPALYRRFVQLPE